MAEQFLDDPQVGPTLEQVGGEGVSQHVRMDVFFQTGPRGQLTEQLPDALVGQLSSPHGQKHFAARFRADSSGRPDER